MAGDEVLRAPSFSPIPGRQDQTRRDREMQNEQSMRTQANTDGQLHERQEFAIQDQEAQRGRTNSTSPPSVEGENDGDFRPPARSKSQIDDEPKRRISTRRKVVDDEEDEPPRSSIDRSMEVRKRKAGSPQVQIAVKKSKTSRAQSEAGESLFVVGAPARDETVLETTETGDSQRPENGGKKTPGTEYPQEMQTRRETCEVNTGDMISKEEHDKRFEEKRAQFNEILKKHQQENKDLKAKLQSVEGERDNFQGETLKWKTKHDRVIQQEDEWFKKVPVKMEAWKKKEVEAEKATLKGWFEKELQKEKKKWEGKFDSQQTKHKKQQEESKEKMKEWKAEITENRKRHENLEKELRREVDQRIKEMKPENQKEMREKNQKISELRSQNKKLEAELQAEKDKYDEVHTYAVNKKAQCTELKKSCFQLQEEKNQALDKASTAEGNYNREVRYGKDVERKYKAALQQHQQQYRILNQNTTESQNQVVDNQRFQFLMRQQNERNNAKVERLEKEVEALRKEKGAVEQQNQTLKKALEEKRSLSAPTTKPQAQRQEARSTSAASRSPSFHQGRQSRHPSVSSPQDVHLHRHAQASSNGSDRHRHSVPDPRTGSTGQGAGDQDDTAAKDSKVVETVEEVHPQAESMEGGPVDYRLLEVRDGGGREGVGRGAGRDGEAMEGVRVGKSPEVAATSPKPQPSGSIFGGKQAIAATGGGSAGASGGAMEGLNVEGKPETTKVETAEDDATPPAGDEATHSVQREGPYGQHGSAANVVTPSDGRTLGDMLARNPWDTMRNGWGWPQQ